MAPRGISEYAKRDQELRKFAVPCAQGVLDPLIIPCPMGRSCSIRSFFYLEASLGALEPESVLLGGSSVAPWWLLGGLPHQGTQHTHYMCQLPPFWSFFPPLAIFFTIFLKKCFLPSVGITCLQINPVHFDAKNPLSGPPGGGKNSDVGNFFTPSASF